MKEQSKCRRCDGRHPREGVHGERLCPNIHAEICDRCLSKMDNPDNHGWFCCELAPSSVNFSANESIAKQRAYKKTIAVDKKTGSEVKVADLIQPFDETGKPNYDFVERYGTKEYKSEDKERIKDTWGS